MAKKNNKNNKTKQINYKQDSNAKKEILAIGKITSTDKNIIMQEEFLDGKLDEKSTFSKIINVILWIVLFAWMAVCLIDFYNFYEKKEPMFCVKKEVSTYDDGKVKSCVGPGYKIYSYERESIKSVEFVPLWAKERIIEK